MYCLVEYEDNVCGVGSPARRQQSMKRTSWLSRLLSLLLFLSVCFPLFFPLLVSLPLFVLCERSLGLNQTALKTPSLIRLVTMEEVGG